MKIDFLQGLGVGKVECGSQFSVALTKAGAVYTWYALFLPHVTPTALLL
jgi:alpha-tubulin suppressor-like RCC1 family protein